MNEKNVTRQSLAHVAVKSTALGSREKPEGRPLPKSLAGAEGFEKYLQRAHAIGYEPSAGNVAMERLKICIAENNILVYDSRVVDDWLVKVIEKEQRATGSDLTLVWRPLTVPMKKKVRYFSFRYQHRRYVHNGISQSYYWGDIDKEGAYQKIIPDAVLTTSEMILKNFNEKDPLVLLVSDYALAQPDPFLAVAMPDHPFMIVDFWDEPGFQPKAADSSLNA